MLKWPWCNQYGMRLPIGSGRRGVKIGLFCFVRIKWTLQGRFLFNPFSSGAVGSVVFRLKVAALCLGGYAGGSRFQKGH